MVDKAKFTQWSEFVASVAIIVTLVFLVVEMRQNTQAIEASTRNAALNGTREFLIQAWQDPDAIMVWTKPDPTDAEILEHFYSLTLLLTSFEGTWVQYQRGVLDKDTWVRQVGALPEVLQYPRNRTWWRNYGENAFDPAFVAEVNGLIADTPTASSPVADKVRRLFEADECRSRVGC